MAAKRSRARQFGGGGSKLDLGQLLAGSLGGGEVQQIPQIQDQGPTQAGGILPQKPAQFQAKSPFWDTISGGKGKQLASQANIQGIQSEEEAQRGIRTKQAEIPINVAQQKALTPGIVEQQRQIDEEQINAEVARLIK